MGGWGSRLILLTLLACNGKGASAPGTTATPEPRVQVSDSPPTVAQPPPAAAPDDWPGSAEAQAMHRALSARDPAPACEAVEALAADPVPELIWLAENVELPPWAGMRAAGCVVRRHGEAAGDTLGAWVTDPGRKGLARVVLGELDQMPEPVAVEVVQAALGGPLQAEARSRAEASAHPAVRGLVAP